ncbi:thioredoxin family protein [Aquibacillus rhizosphaerae]|uniref:Thioredoxin family protein n=1 Tax=Aquibacillus rhizosphaerae TaxID=3051431 RepID=A0ABT7L245_9BACI|nr:thioredoxin family protein [Aquibacillus sp. LR5S19]MDL4839928.1 thioredoxin family protein [Aquibacillus sp. LR5S19]
MKEITLEVLKDETKELILFIHTPLCGTCHIARKMLVTVEVMKNNLTFYEVNASFFPDFMQEKRIESVPCLLIMKAGRIQERVYSFESVVKLNSIINRHFFAE